MSDTENERIQEFLLAFVDFLYAVLFGIILQQVYSDVLVTETIGRFDKLVRVLLVAGVFYFLLGDWIQGRLLTLRNPYRTYKRFFVEVGIAFAGYGAAIEALKADILFVMYVILVLLLGSYWALCSLRELADERDVRELQVVIVVQSSTALLVGSASFLWYLHIGYPISLGGMVMFYCLGWLYDFSYELFAPVREGLESGSGVPFLSKRNVSRIKAFLKVRE